MFGIYKSTTEKKCVCIFIVFEWSYHHQEKNNTDAIVYDNSKCHYNITYLKL